MGKRINNRSKMYRTNSLIKTKLYKLGFTNIYLFPHLRFIKDWIFEDCGFDAIGIKKDSKYLHLLQFKTNKKLSKKELQKYKLIEEKYFCKCMWVTKVEKKILLFSIDYPKGIELF